jgi:hypothetical protein
MAKYSPEPVMLRQMTLQGRLRPVAIFPASGRANGQIAAVTVDGRVVGAHFRTTMRNTTPLHSDDLRYPDIIEALQHAIGGNYRIVHRRSPQMKQHAEEGSARHDAQQANA